MGFYNVCMLKFLKKRLQAGSGRALKVGKGFSIPPEVYATTGERDAILASSGMGKSYLTGVLIEESLETGSLVCIIDPEGEHFTLAERYPMLIIGGEHGNLPLDEDALDLYIETMLQNRYSAVFDLSEFLDEEQQHLYGVIAEHLFNLEQKYRQKIRLVVEEAQIYAPQRGGGGRKKKGVKDPVQASQRIAKRGRKRAIDSLWATQRPASLNKDILSQCNRFWFGGITSEQDYKAIKPYLNQAGISFDDVKALNPGEFYYYGKNETKKIKVRKRLCKHAGATPEAGLQFNATTDSSMDESLSRLSEMINKRAIEKQKEESEANRLKAVIRDLEKQLKKVQKELEEERMATKVIERLGSKPPAKKQASKPEYKTADQLIDEIEAGDKIKIPERTLESGELQKITETKSSGTPDENTVSTLNVGETIEAEPAKKASKG